MTLCSVSALQHMSELPANTRNFCMVAHVDHGKTTLSDYLVASNGVLSSQLAGEVRLLDSRPDEQERCITMKASSIALHHVYDGVHHVLNLVDSPGHIDFSCEVSTAMRLCDGAVIIVDVVDGVTQQTCAMLRHAYREGLSMCLVLNKIDLLITTQQFSAEEAYVRMRTILETCNATLAAYANQMHIQEDEADMQRDDPSDDVWFDPCKGNVLFCSCHDGWGFDLATFVRIYKDKLPIDAHELQAALWGEYYLDPKTKTVATTPKKPGQAPLAVQLLLDPIWKLYSTFLEAEGGAGGAAGNGNGSSYNGQATALTTHSGASSCAAGGASEQDRALLQRCVAMSTRLGVAERVWNNPRRDWRGRLKALLSAWLPLARCVLDVICGKMDSPVQGQQRRLPALMPQFARAPPEVRAALLACDTAAEAPCIVYVCKLIDTQFLVGRVVGGVESAEEDAFVGFARVYSGRLRAGQLMYLYSEGTVVHVPVSRVFLFRGTGLEDAAADCGVCAGSLCGVGGVTRYITKHATLSSVPDVPLFRPLALPSTSIVRLSVLPRDPKELGRLEEGLRWLYRVDPQVEIAVLPTGEHVIGTAGEVHAERCIKDLVDTFARIELVVSEPIVSFRETIVGSGGRHARPKLCTTAAPDNAFSITLYAKPFSPDVLEVIKDDERNNGNNEAVVRQVDALLAEDKRFASEMQHGVIAHGPTRLGFLGAVLLVQPDNGNSTTDVEGEDEETTMAVLQTWRESIVAGFQAAAESGPMAQEPLYGLAFVIVGLRVDPAARLSGGLVLPCVRDACRAAMEQHPRRLVEPIYECTVYSSGATQGKIYASLSRRRAEIIEEVPNEGSDLFHVRCWLPAVEAFGLQDELRVQTQGASTAQLHMSHWALIEADPYFVPTTKEEIEEHGAELATKNIAELLLERTRRRKGLFRERVVESAEKQKFSLKGA